MRPHDVIGDLHTKGVSCRGDVYINVLNTHGVSALIDELRLVEL